MWGGGGVRRSGEVRCGEECGGGGAGRCEGVRKNTKKKKRDRS